MKKKNTRILLFSLAAIALWIASAILLVSGLSFVSDGKWGEFFVALIMAALLGFFGFRIKLKSFSEKIKTNSNIPFTATEEKEIFVTQTKIHNNNKDNNNNKIETKPETIKKSTGAPTLAGYTLSYSYTDVKIAEYEHCKAQNMQPGDDIVFLHEKDNPYDNKAVSVHVRGEKVGLLPKDRLQDMYHDFTAQNGLILGTISNTDPQSPTMSIVYYKNNTENDDYFFFLKSGKALETFKLSSNKNEEMQDNISACSVGDEVEASYDYDKEKYMAYCFDEIGFFPKSANSLLDHDFKAFVERIEQNEDDEYQIFITIFEA